jgi:hypothetical protein
MRWILSFVILVVPNCYGQDTVTKYIVVDTIVLGEGMSPDIENYFSFLRRADDNYVSFAHDWWDSNHFPSLCSKISFVSHKDLALSMLLDNRGSTIELHNLENLGDTIHISRYTIHNNCLFDSIKSSIFYYHHIADTQVVVYKEKHTTTLPTTHCDTLKRVVLDINHRRYDIVIQYSKTQPLQYYDGYPKRRDQRRKYRCQETRKKWIKFNSFSGSVTSFRYQYSGRVDFQ